MIRSELIDTLVAKNPGLASRDIEAIVDCFFEEVVAQLAHGGRVELRGFGTFPPASAKPALVAIRAPARPLKLTLSGCRTSNRARKCALV